MLKEWDCLPEFMRISEVRPYWEALKKKESQIVLKRLFDFVLALILFVILIIPMAVIAIMVKLDSPGPVFYRQERVTAYGKKFRIHKFRTMVNNADQIGSGVTVSDDERITKTGRTLRRLRLDEIPQVIDILEGTMSFVGTRPESVKYVRKYKPEYFATLLLPAGVTSEASIRFKDEDKMLSGAENIDQVYINDILPEKMRWNLEAIKTYSFIKDILTMARTICAVAGKDEQ